MAKFIPKTYEQVLQREIDRAVARSKLPDLTETSARKAVLSATAREIADAYFQMKNLVDVFSIDRAAGDDLDERAKDYNPAVISRNPATLASGTLPSVMEEAGSKGNVAAAVLTKFKGLRPAGLDTVTNLAGFVGGADKETDDSFRARIKDFVATLSRCTPQALETAALTVEMPSGQRIVFAKVVEDPILLGLVYLYVDDGTGAAETVDDNYGGPETLTQGVEFPGDVAQGGGQYLYTHN